MHLCILPLCSIVRLLGVVALRNVSAADGEDESGGRSSVVLIAGPVGIDVPFESNWCGRIVEDVVIHRPTYIT